MDDNYPGISKYPIIVSLLFKTIIKYSNLTFIEFNDLGPPNPIKANQNQFRLLILEILKKNQD